MFLARHLPLLLLLAASLPAQNRGRHEIFGHAGFNKAYDDEGSVGGGLSGGGSFGYRLTPRLAVEIDINALQHERDIAGPDLTFRGNAAFVTGNLAYHFSDSRIQPYVIGGTGFSRYQARGSFENQLVRFTENGLAINAGGGIKGYITDHIVLRPEIRYYSGGTGDIPGLDGFVHSLRVSVGLGYVW